MLYSCTHMAAVGVKGLTTEYTHVVLSLFNTVPSNRNELDPAFFQSPDGGTAAAAQPPFRPSDPALCGSCPPVTPY